MRFRLLVLAVVVALAFPAAAQDATVELEISNASEEEQVTAGESVDLGFDVAITVDGATCYSAVDLPVNATGTPSTQGATVTDDEVAFSLGPGDSTLETYQEQTSASVAVDTESGQTQDSTLEVDLQANFGGLESESCIQSFPAAESNVLTTTITVQADQEPPEDDENDTGGDDDGDDPNGPDDGADGGAGGPADDGEPAEENGSPLPAALALVAALGAALLRRG